MFSHLLLHTYTHTPHNHSQHHKAVVYITLLGMLALVLSGVVFTLFASSNKAKFKPDVEFDDLAPGLNIDLGYYLFDDTIDFKKKRKKKEELLTLLNAR